MTGWIAVALGDVTGIGPEVTLKALARLPAAGDSRYLVIGDERLVRQLNQRLGLNLTFAAYAEARFRAEARFFLHDPCSEALPEDLAPGAPAAAQAAVAYLTEGARRCLAHETDALVTAPVNKESIIRLGQPFTGQTEFLSEMAGTSRTAMMLLGDDDRGRWLRVALATTHVPLKMVSDHLSQAKIELVIELAAHACRDLGLPRARIGVCGLNPHAGEGGKFGTEEGMIIEPAVQAARLRQFDVDGPWAADSLFYHAFQGEYDAVVAMYHDQGLVPLKMIGFERGVNWTLGLPFIRTSPDHGTAYDIAGQNKADPRSMLAALELAAQLARTRALAADGARAR